MNNREHVTLAARRLLLSGGRPARAAYWMELYVDHPDRSRRRFLGQPEGPEAARAYVRRFPPDSRFRLIMRLDGRILIEWVVTAVMGSDPTLKCVFNATGEWKGKP